MNDVENAAQALDRIRAGGQQLLMSVRVRIGEALGEMDAGNFSGAVMHLAEAHGILQQLSNAQTYLAIAGDSYLIRARELEVGMKLTNIGEVVKVESEPCVEGGDHVTVFVGEQEMAFRPAQLIYVQRDDTGDE